MVLLRRRILGNEAVNKVSNWRYNTLCIMNIVWHELSTQYPQDKNNNVADIILYFIMPIILSNLKR